MEPVGANPPEDVAETDGAGVGLGLGVALALVDDVGLDPALGEGVVPLPEHANTAKATHKITTAAGLTVDRGTSPAVRCRTIVATPPQLGRSWTPTARTCVES
jgi:hypothetical protein